MDIEIGKRNTVTRDHLARAVKDGTGIPIKRASNLIEQLFSRIAKELRNNKKVKLRLFGTFVTKHKGARMGRNPKNLEKAIIAERTVIKFKVAPTLKKRINNNIHQIMQS